MKKFDAQFLTAVDIVCAECAFGSDNRCVTCPVRMTVEGRTDPVSLEDLNISVRAYNCLKRAGYNTVDDFADATVSDLMRVRNLGRKCVWEICAILQQHGITIPDPKGELEE